MNSIFGVDIGGTNIKFGKFVDGDLQDFFEVHTNPQEDNPIEPILNIIEEQINSHLDGDDLVGIGVAVPGPVCNGVVLGAENLYWLTQVRLKELLEDRFNGVKIAILNDANAATLGEWYFGNGNKCDNMVFLTLGTGIGSGIIIDKKLYLGANGSAGEVGHIKIVPFKGRPCSCGLYGCLEQYASATGIRKTAYGLRRNKKTLLNEHGRIGVRDIFDAAYQNDKVALDVINKTAYYLAIGLCDIACTINPEIILLGGGVSKGELFQD